MPCSLYKKTGKTYIVSNTSNSTRCTKYARLKKKYNIKIPTISDQEALEKAKQKLKDKEQATRAIKRLT